MVDNNLDKYTIIVEEQDNYIIELNGQGPQGARGPQGEVGPVGPKGDAATIEVGNVTTGVEGSDVSVVNSGTSSNAVFDFEIPRGDKGEAATIVVGSTTTGAAGTEANVVNKGTSLNAILDFTIPKGDKGDKGDKGEQGDIGPANTLTVGSVTKGDEAEVTIEGKSPNQTINFVLPKGDKGDTGPQGIQGVQGIQGPKGETGPSNVLSIGSVTKGDEASASITGDSPNQILNLVLPKGDKGNTGAQGPQGVSGISVTGVEQISKVGLVATYRMYFSDGTHFDYEVTDGSVEGVTREQVISLIGYEPASYTSVEGLTTRVSTLDERVEDLTTALDSKQDKGNYALKSEIPTNNNQLTNGAGYITSSYHDSTKQDVIADLATIRSGAAKGATAIQNTNDCVHLTGNETVKGNKVFSSGSLADQPLIMRNSNTGTPGVRFQTGTNLNGIIGVHSTHIPIYSTNGSTINNALVRSAFNTAVGSKTEPVYINSSGVATAITSYEGNSATATKATQDSSGQQINTTYIKGVTASNATITVTKGNGTTSTATINNVANATNATNATKAIKDGSGNIITTTYTKTDLSNLTEEGLKVIKDNSGSGLEVCDIGTSLYVDETKGLRRYLNGQIVSINANTQAFLNRLLEIKNTNPDYFTTEDNWQAEALLNIDGCVYKFVLNYADDGETIISVRLPKYPDYVEVDAGNVAVVGNGLNLGLTTGSVYGALGTRAGNGIDAFTGQYGLDVGTAINGYSQSMIDATNPTWRSLGVTTDPTKSGIVGTLTQTKLKLRYFIQIATGSETENNIINDIELNNPYSLFDSKYSPHELNNLSWLKSEGQWNAKAVYPTAYDELLKEYNNPDRLATFNKDAFKVVGSPTITDDGVATGFNSSNYIRIPFPSSVTNFTAELNFKFNDTSITSYSNYCIHAGSSPFMIYINASNGKYDNINAIFTNSDISTQYNLGTISSSSHFLTERVYFEYRLLNNMLSCRVRFGETGDWINFPTTYTITDAVSTKAYSLLASNSSNFNCDLKQFSITVDGVKVFSGAKSKVKLSTETYTDYDFVLNTAEETFRLPLLNGSEDLPSEKYDDLELGVPGTTYNIHANGFFVIFGKGTGNAYLYVKNNTTTAQNMATGANNVDLVTSIEATRGDVCKIDYYDTTLTDVRFIYAQGNGSLYFYVGETVQNANLIDAGRLGEQLAGKVDTSNTQWATNACVPDYSAGISVTEVQLKSGYTFPYTGVLIVSAEPASNGTVKINDLTFTQHYVTGTCATPIEHHGKEGTKITYSSFYKFYQAYYFPLVGVK